MEVISTSVKPLLTHKDVYKQNINIFQIKNEDEDPDYDFPISLTSFIKNNPEYSANEDENCHNSNNESTHSK